MGAVSVWLLFCWGWTKAMTRPCDDAKNLIFYTLAFGLFIYTLFKHGISAIGWLSKVLIASVLLYFGASLISLIGFGIAEYEGFLEIARLILWCGFTYSLILIGDIWKIIGKVSVVSASVMVILNVLSLPWIGWGPWEWNKFAYLPIGHVSYYGIFMALHIPLIIYFISKSVSLAEKGLWWICALLVFLGVLFSGARAPLLGVTIGVLIPIFIGLAQGKRVWKLALGTALVPTLLLSGLYLSGNWKVLIVLTSKMSNYFQAGAILPAGRAHNFKATAEMIADGINFGHGIGNFRFIYPEYGKEGGLSKHFLYHPHNEILHQAAEVGRVGLWVWLFGLCVVYWRGFRAVIYASNAESIILGLAGLTIVLVSWQFDTSYTSALIRAMAAVYVSLILKPKEE